MRQSLIARFLRMYHQLDRNMIIGNGRMHVAFVFVIGDAIWHQLLGTSFLHHRAKLVAMRRWS